MSSFAKSLRCRECAREYPKKATHVCEFCFGPLEVAYDYQAIGRATTRDTIVSRPSNMWRYRELLPLDRAPTTALEVGMTPLIRARRLAERLGVKELWIKNDAVCHPSLSFKDRVVSVALNKALELGFSVVGCASTGNLANSVAANSAACGLRAYVLIPHDLEQAKVLGTLVYGARVVAIRGTYDDVNRLCSEIADKHGWGFVNVNLRPYYSDGSKTYAYEVLEQLGWRAPDHIVAPMAGGSLVTKIGKAIHEFHELGWIETAHTQIHGAQGDGCAPIVEAVLDGRDVITPIKQPRTLAKSLAIGNPADGYYAVQTIRESRGWAHAATDQQIVDGIRLLAESEGIFTETAGGVTVAATRVLIESGRIGPRESVVICITGQGLKTQEAIAGQLPVPPLIGPRLAEFDHLLESISE